VLAIMGSGETAPTMVATHREIVARLGGHPRAVLLDTPYGFQENARDLATRAADYFARSVQLAIEPVGFPGPLAADPAARDAWPTAAALARLRSADYVFAGPGSPTYALSVWHGSPVPEALATTLAQGGALVFASAAALTLGRFTLPVYEIYKVGQPPHWLDGLDLLGAAGMGSAWAVIPHFDNAEGGTHDTRFCYMGERRLAALEAMLPDEARVLGVDEHTALVIDLHAGSARVTGRGAVTLRRGGTARRIPAGPAFPLAALLEETDRATTAGAPPAEPGAGQRATPGLPRTSPLRDEVTRLEQAFEAALALRQATGAANAAIDLDRTIAEWSGDTLQSDEPDRARAVLHALIHRLGETAGAGLRDPRETLTPLVDALIALRSELRARRAWELADRVRDHLAAAGIEIRDAPDGTHWVLRRD
jgi:hypothetical protein